MIQTAQACLRATNSTIGRIILYKQLHYTRVTALITFILGAVYINAQDNILCPIPINICDMASITEVDLSMVTKDSNLSGDILAINNNTSAAQPTAECHHTDSGIDCHQFIITRPNESISGFSTLLQYGNPCGGQFNVDSVYIEMGKTCSKLIDPDKNTPVFFEFSDCINEMTVTMCSNRGETVSFCGIQVSTFEVVASYQNGSDCDDGNVIVVVSNSGPSGPYLYSWLNEDGVEVSTDASPSPPLAPGDYTIIVTDGPSGVTAIDQITVEASGSNCCELTINGTGSPVDIEYCDLPSIDPNDLFTNMGYSTSGACGDVLIQICPINFVECTAGTYDIDFLLTDDMGTVEIADDTHLTICSSINITVTQPTITSNPSTNQDLNCNPSEIVAPVFTVTDPCDTSDPSDPSDPSATIEEGDVIIDGCMRTQTWTATYEGACQNAEPVEIMYTWTEDDEAPQLTVPDDEFLGCDPVKPTMQSVMAASSVIDNCGATISVTPGLITGDCTKTQIFTVTANDDCGDLSDTEIVTYTWTDDDEAPQLTVPDDEFLGCNPVKPTMQSVMAASSVTDNCEATISVSAGPITGDCTKSQTFTVIATDDCGDRSDTETVTFTWTEDNQAPMLTVPAGGDLDCNPDALPSMQSVLDQSSVIDNCGATISVSPGQITGDCTKTQIFTVTATDNCGDLSDTKTVTYTWTEDNQAPVLTVPAGGDLDCNPDALPSMQSVLDQSSVTDNCGATISVSAGQITGDCTKTQIFTVTATDDCGDLSDTETVTYTWSEGQSVTLTVPEDQTEDSCQDQEAINEAFQDWLDQVIFSGGCNAEIMDGDPEPPHYCGGEVKVMWTVTSDCGEEVSDMALFTVEDSPPIVGLPVADMRSTECLDSDVVENEFQEWLVDFSDVSGGCDLSVSYNITETIDNLDGTITINTYTVSSLSEINGPTACDMSIEIEMVISDDCHEDVIIAATFIVPQGIRGIEMEGEGEVCAGFDGYIFRATTMLGGDLSPYDITWKYIDENGVTNPAEFIITSGQGTPTVEIGMYLNASPGTLQVCVSDAFNTVTSSIPITFKPHRACNIRCENYLYVSQHMANDPAQLDFHAAGVVESDNSIPAIPGNTTEFTAKFSVNLLPGFCVEPGAQFEAQIANRCDEDGFQEENTNFESKSKH